MSDFFSGLLAVAVIVFSFALQAMWVAGTVLIGFWLLKFVGIL
jgi:hypothetical protein